MGADLSNIGILLRREIEARMVGPLYQAFAKEFGEEKTLAIVKETIVKLAMESGEDLSRWVEGNDLAAFEKGLELWTRDNALEIEILDRSETRLSFNVTRCRYAEMYKETEIPELGKVLSCARDFAMVEGFNPGIRLTRTQTIMEGADFCDFRYQVVEDH
jgi:L-2-amino-thiazoline-4-carboxylic acid hydrolase-like protein